MKIIKTIKIPADGVHPSINVDAWSDGSISMASVASGYIDFTPEQTRALAKALPPATARQHEWPGTSECISCGIHVNNWSGNDDCIG